MLYRKGFFMKKKLHHIKAGHMFIIGSIIILLSLIPSLILGQDSIVYYHDQLDGELIAYIYQAKYLFSGQNIIPEFMNGAAKSALVVPAPLAILFFRAFSPLSSYMLLLAIGQLCAFSGMFLLIRKITENHYIAFITAILYAFLPFLPLYGLTQYGVPLLIYCFLQLSRRKNRKPAFLYICLYTAMSSLVLLGFVWLLLGLLLFIYFFFTKQLKKQLHLLLSFAFMAVIYITTNLSLILQMLGVSNSYVSHKSEYVLSSTPFLSQTVSYITDNSTHATDYHRPMLLLLLSTIVLSLICYKKLASQTLKYLKYILQLFTLICSLCMIAALWSTPFVIGIRQHFGALKSFQFSRILWLTPTLWYIILALCLGAFLQEKRALRIPQYIIAFMVLVMVGIGCLKGSFAKPNAQALLTKEYDTISWSDYLALGVMNQVEEYIHTEKGQQIDEYKIVSLGIDPAAALYHGFYSIDGYSNNYDLEHKHAFRKVIAPELNKNDYLKSHFDDWGNRCYLFSSQIPGYYNIQKNTFWYNELEINTKELKSMGCDYILSAAYITNSADLNLTLVREEPFSTPTSYYQIFLYQIEH